MIVGQITYALAAVFVLGVIFDYINGFHDTANAIATSVSTRALRPEYAIMLSAVANFTGALYGTEVAATIGSGIVSTPGGVHGQVIVVAALVGAIAWNLVTWLMALPSSSSHALIGGLLGATMAALGASSVHAGALLEKVVLPLVTSPVIGLAGAFGLMVVLLNVFRRADPHRLNDRFRRLQLVSAAFMAFSHGSNDAQKTMGIMTLALVTAGILPAFKVPIWVILIAAAAMSFGTMAGGWRIIKTMGQRVVKLDPVHGFAAETAAATVIMVASHLGMPVSTTHVISGAIMGSGASNRLTAVRWGIAGSIVWAWVLTIPASALVAGIAWIVIHAVTAG